MRNHEKFILTPIITLLKSAQNACANLPYGIESYPLINYILQSVFIRMTGFQEQKGRCLLWELATDDYEFRYRQYYQKRDFGECSKYSDKKEIIKQYSHFVDIENLLNKMPNIVEDAMKSIKSFAEEFNLGYFSQDLKILSCFIKDRIKQVGEVKKNDRKSNKQNVLCKVLNLFDNEHNVLYKERNRIAHNVWACNENLPTFEIITDYNYKYNSFLNFFYVLIVIDQLYMEIYKQYTSIHC